MKGNILKLLFLRFQFSLLRMEDKGNSKIIYFKEDTYQTNPNTPRLFMDKMVFNSRIVFLIKFIGHVFKASSKARKGQYNTADWAKSSNDIFKLIERCGGRFSLSGLDNIAKAGGPVIFVSNHMSILETMIFPGIIAPRKETTFVVKENLITYPVFGAVMRSRNPIVVSRSNSREDLMTVLTKGQELLSKGISIVIFPQHTRNVQFKPEEFNSLAVKLAAKAGVKVVPIAIKTDFWTNGKYLKDFGAIHRDRTIHMAFGEPMPVVGTGKEEHKKIVDFIAKHLERWNIE
ncbi:MAG: lysophospholipid acyltransferase family protein [Bacteroidales bacterium]